MSTTVGTIDTVLNWVINAPTGEYLIEEADGLRRLWRITGTEPDDDTIAPAADSMLLASASAPTGRAPSQQSSYHHAGCAHCRK
jgi:hypothetical protein